MEIEADTKQKLCENKQQIINLMDVQFEKL